MMLGTSIGVNMLRTDPKLWVTVGPNYTGFVYKPNKGWLDATTKTTDKHNRNNDKGKSAVQSMSSTTNKVCA